MAQSLFNFSTIECHLIPATKTLRVSAVKSRPVFGLELLFEIDSLFNWLMNKTEINSVLLECGGLAAEFVEKSNLSKFSNEKLIRIEELVAKINQGCLSLPQTFIADFGNGGCAHDTELFIGADIKVANTNALLKFDHLKRGLFPSGGNMAIMSEFIGNARTINWIMSGKTVTASELEACGLIHSTYDSTNRWDIINQILFSISEQSPVNRIQTKAAFYHHLKNAIESNLAYEQSLAKAAYSTGDWKKDFQSPREFGKTAKLSVVEN